MERQHLRQGADKTVAQEQVNSVEAAAISGRFWTARRR
jgi:hypothetical protein